MKHILLLLAFFLSVLLLQAKANFTVKSPNGKVKVEVGVDNASHLFYRVLSGREEVIAPSSFGIVANGVDLGENVTFGKSETRTINETYRVMGVHTRAINHFNEKTIAIQSKSEKWLLDVRAYNDGIALRSRFPAKSGRHIEGETTRWNIPSKTIVWYQNDFDSYEGLFIKTLADTISVGKKICLPVTAELPSGKFALFTEANLADYTDLAVISEEGGVFKALFHAEPEGWETSEEVTQPWRVTLVADNLNSLVNSDLIGNLCPPPAPGLAGADWIRPGRAAWNWWSTPSLIYEEQHQWVDWTKQLGFEYYLIDAGWQKWRDGEKDSWGCLKEVVDYARSVGVDTWIWVHSKNEVPDEASRKKVFENAKKAGVVGIKIDFVPKCTREWSNWYVATLRDAANLKLMIDFHGTVKPTGLNRTWPNELTREAVRGHEWHILRYKRTMPQAYDCTAPFNRFVVGPADYTPVVFNPDELRGFTWSRELAQAIVFTSPLLCYADHPTNYLDNPARELLEAIPAIWDETLVLPGSEIGKCAAFARRKGNEWFIGIINGPEESELDIPFSFLGKGSWQMDTVGDVPGKNDAVEMGAMDIAIKDRLQLVIRPGGGFVARIRKPIIQD